MIKLVISLLKFEPFVITIFSSSFILILPFWDHKIAFSKAFSFISSSIQLAFHFIFNLTLKSYFLAIYFAFMFLIPIEQLNSLD